MYVTSCTSSYVGSRLMGNEMCSSLGLYQEQSLEKALFELAGKHKKSIYDSGNFSYFYFH